MRKKDLEMLEAMLYERKEQLERNIVELNKDIDDLKNMELKDDADYASANDDNMRDEAIARQQQVELNEINYAISKVKRGNYGVCEMCEDDIGIPRLKAKPFAKYCIVCREIVEKEMHKKRSVDEL